MSNLSALVDRFAGVRMLVIGDVMVDEYLYGSVDRISPEAPVPIVALKQHSYQLGGAANVALNGLALGGQVSLVGLYGSDDVGQTLRRVATNNGLDPSSLVQSTTRRTTRKARVLSSGQQLLRVDTEDIDPATNVETAALLASIKTEIQLRRPAVVLFEDYDKGVLTGPLITEVIRLCRAEGIPTVVDPKARNFWSYQEVSLFKPNLKEVSDALPELAFAKTEGERLLKAHASLQRRLRHEKSLITLGAGGAYLAHGDQQLRVQAHHRDIVDVCGAGDTVVTTAALALATGASDSDLLSLSNLAGGLACEHVGVRPVSAAELRSGAAEL